MKALYLVRHGIALDLGQGGITRDFDRPLSSRGAVKTRAVAEGLLALGVKPESIGSSALVRARETADILREVLSPDQPEVICDFMAPGGASASLFNWLKSQPASSVMLVGHMPDLSTFTALCQPPETRQWVTFKKAGCACIRFENQIGPGCGELEWYRSPSELRGVIDETDSTSSS